MNTTKKTIKRVEHDLKAHNVATIEKILEFYKTERKCCAIQATGTGKTFLILRLLEIYNDEGKVAVIFAPNREIIKQTKKRMKKFGLNNATFYTYQKLARMTHEEISAMEFDLIVCDELHRTGAKTWGQKFEVLVNSHPESKVFGVTATPLRCTDGRDMADEYFDGNKACDISLAEALVREIIPVMPLYVSALYTFEEEYQNMSEKIEKANNSMEEKLELQKELLAAKQQLEKANGVPEIIKKYITNYNGKYLIFCKDKKHLYAMKDVVVSWFREAGYNGKIFEYPYYSDSSAVRKNLENFENNKEDGLKLLFIIDKLNEGLHLDEIHGCILLRTTVSNIIYYQQIGRAIDAGSTEQRVILDLVSNFNSLKSFNLKKELEQKVKERRNGNFSECSSEFELDKFDVVDLIQPCIDIFNRIDKEICYEFELMFEKYARYLKDNNKDRVSDGENHELAKWEQYQRAKYKQGKMNQEHYEKLLGINFLFDDIEYSEFMMFVNALKKYYNTNNNLDIPTNYIDDDGMHVGKILMRINRSYNNGKLPDYKLKTLLDLGYDFKSVYQRMFEEKFMILVDRFKKTGSWICMVGEEYQGVDVYSFTQKIIQTARKGKLQDYQIRMITEYDFPTDTVYNQKLKILLHFLENNTIYKKDLSVYKNVNIGNLYKNLLKKYQEKHSECNDIEKKIIEKYSTKFRNVS